MCVCVCVYQFCISSWMDEVVPLWSASAASITTPHTNMMRAIYVREKSAEVFAESFLGALVQLCVQVLNRGAESEALVRSATRDDKQLVVVIDACACFLLRDLR